MADKQQATLEIRIWSEGDEFPSDLPDFFQDHAEHVAKMVREGYICGEICPDGNFRGWWEIKAP